MYIGEANMSLIRPWVHGNALGSEAFTVQCNLKHIGVVATACISDGGNFVDVYGEFGGHHFSHRDTKIRG